jgi:hypothetical protein
LLRDLHRCSDPLPARSNWAEKQPDHVTGARIAGRDVVTREYDR